MDIENNIDWHRLIWAIDYYKSKGYKFIDLNWTIPSKISEITKPIGRKDYLIEEEALVASAEQSFLELMYDSKLEKGRYCGITPCFRDEDYLDELHQRYFMKVELIDTLNVNHTSLGNMIIDAKEFYSNYLDVHVLEIQDEMYDIIDDKNGIELGSYGTRRTIAGNHVFGTGLAEPRLSKVLKLQ